MTVNLKWHKTINLRTVMYLTVRATLKCAWFDNGHVHTYDGHVSVIVWYYFCRVSGSKSSRWVENGTIRD